MKLGSRKLKSGGLTPGLTGPHSYFRYLTCCFEVVIGGKNLGWDFEKLGIEWECELRCRRLCHLVIDT